MTKLIIVTIIYWFCTLIMPIVYIISVVEKASIKSSDGPDKLDSPLHYDRYSPKKKLVVFTISSQVMDGVAWFKVIILGL